MVFKVGKNTNVKSLGSAVAMEFEKTECIVIRAIGVQAVNQATKAIAVAGGFLGQKGKAIITKIGFASVDIPENAEGDRNITGINFACKIE